MANPELTLQKNHFKQQWHSNVKYLLKSLSGRHIFPLENEFLATTAALIWFLVFHNLSYCWTLYIKVFKAQWRIVPNFWTRILATVFPEQSPSWAREYKAFHHYLVAFHFHFLKAAVLQCLVEELAPRKVHTQNVTLRVSSIGSRE